MAKGPKYDLRTRKQLADLKAMREADGHPAQRAGNYPAKTSERRK